MCNVYTLQLLQSSQSTFCVPIFYSILRHIDCVVKKSEEHSTPACRKQRMDNTRPTATAQGNGDVHEPDSVQMASNALLGHSYASGYIYGWITGDEFCSMPRNTDERTFPGQSGFAMSAIRNGF